MAKFNKDTFINELTDNVRAAIDKELITREDIQSNNIERLHAFIQYILLENIENRKYAIDVLREFNYDEKMPWEKLEDKFGKFTSILDIALVNLWSFLKAEGATEYAYYRAPVNATTVDVSKQNQQDQNIDDLSDIVINKSDDADSTDSDVAPYEEEEQEREHHFKRDDNESARKKLRIRRDNE